MSDTQFTETTPASHSVPEISEIETLLISYKVSPGGRFYKIVANADWTKPADLMLNKRSLNNRLRWAFVVLGVLVAVGIIGASPFGNTLAQAISKFFKISPTENMTITIETAPNQTIDPGFPNNAYTLQVAEAGALAGFKVKVPTNLGYGWQFHGAKYTSELQQITLFYTFRYVHSTIEKGQPDIYLYIKEQTGEFENRGWGACPTNALVDTQVNGLPAELLDGAVWVTMTKPEPGVQQKWWCEKHESGRFMTLRWQDEMLKYEISLTQPASDEPILLTQQELIDIAESMK